MKNPGMNRIGVVAAIMAALCVSPALGQYTLEVEIDPPDAGAVASYPDSPIFEDGDFVTITATAAEGYAFVGWEGDIASTDSSMTFGISDNTYLKAVFEESSEEPLYTITAYVNPSGAGTIVREPADFGYEAGEVVTLTAYAGEGYAFSGWEGDLPDDADPANPELVITVSEDIDLQAGFALAETLADDDSATAAPCGAVGALGMGLMMTCMLMLKLAGGPRRR